MQKFADWLDKVADAIGDFIDRVIAKVRSWFDKREESEG